MHQLFGQLIGVLVFFLLHDVYKRPSGNRYRKQGFLVGDMTGTISIKKKKIKVPCTVSLLETLYRISRIHPGLRISSGVTGDPFGTIRMCPFGCILTSPRGGGFTRLAESNNVRLDITPNLGNDLEVKR